MFMLMSMLRLSFRLMSRFMLLLFISVIHHSSYNIANKSDLLEKRRIRHPMGMGCCPPHISRLLSNKCPHHGHVR